MLVMQAKTQAARSSLLGFARRHKATVSATIATEDLERSAYLDQAIGRARQAFAVLEAYTALTRHTTYLVTAHAQATTYTASFAAFVL